ncbi:MAG: hypothetical protein AB7I24_06985 [Candidatus Nanopelagicales bacterium]
MTGDAQHREQHARDVVAALPPIPPDVAARVAALLVAPADQPDR